MSLRKIKNPYSLIAFFIIALGYLLVHLLENKIQLTTISFIYYFLIFLFGIGFIRQTLLIYFTDRIAGFTILLLAFGTNLFCLVALDYQLQPILLFSLYSMVVFFTAEWHRNQKLIYSIFLGFSIGMIFIFQPTGFLSLVIPVLWGVHDKISWKLKVMLIKNNFSHFLAFLSCLFIFVLPVVFIWNVSPGEVQFLSFKLPGVFYSFSSWLWNDLFSFDHGLFIYTPIIILAVIGFYFFAEKNRPIFYAVFLFCAIDLFLESSWSKLGSTPIFGQVAFIPAYALLIFPIGSLIDLILKGHFIYRIILPLILLVFISLNVFQTWQVNEGIMMKSGMNPKNYQIAFCRLSISEVDKQRMMGIQPDSCFILKDETKFNRVNLVSYDFENSQVDYKNKLEGSIVKYGKLAFTMDQDTRFSPAWQSSYHDFMLKRWVGFRITVSVYAPDQKQLPGVNLVISSLHGATNYLYKRLNLGDLKLKPAVWNTVSFDYLIPDHPQPDDYLASYVWFTGNGVIYIDNLKYDAFEPKK